MGIEYALVNHRDKTMFELGKGFSEGFLDKDWAKDENSVYDALIDSIPESHKWEDGHVEIVFERLKSFVGRTPNLEIELVNDSDGSSLVYRDHKFYTPVGSRYGSTDEEEQELIAKELEWQAKARAAFEKDYDRYHKAEQIAKQVVWHLTRNVYKAENSEQTKNAIDIAARIIGYHV